MDFGPAFGDFGLLFAAGAAGQQLAAAVVDFALVGSDILFGVGYIVYSYRNTIGYIVEHMSFDFHILNMHSFYHL